jgi:hypothetical protein
MSSSFSVYSYYATNTVVIEECTKGAINRLNTFESAKMRCLNSTWRQGTITLEYSCTGNQLKREWTMRTTVNQGAQWPQDVFILTSTGNIIDYLRKKKSRIFILFMVYKR